MIWALSNSHDRRALPIANRHYNRQTPDSNQFAPPGRRLVLISRDETALWCTSWPLFVQHAWPGSWNNTLFRKEGDGLASDMIRQAVAATRWHFGDPPEIGMITFVDPKKVRHKRDVGRCYLKSGFELIAVTPKGLYVFQLRPDRMPAPEAPWGAQEELF